MSAEKIEISNAYLNPLILASVVFEREQPEANLKDYIAWIYPHEDNIAISFIRERVVNKGPPLKVEHKGHTGRSMTILINKESNTVVSWSYDR